MTLKECFDSIGADYSDAVTRMSGEARLLKFLPMFVKDPTYGDLLKAFENEDWEAAFRAAHTMKGVCANFSFTKLQASSSELCEMLRPCVFNPEAAAQLEIVKADYAQVIDALSKLN